jgi:hypothetical protein
MGAEEACKSSYTAQGLEIKPSRPFMTHLMRRPGGAASSGVEHATCAGRLFCLSERGVVRSDQRFPSFTSMACLML